MDQKLCQLDFALLLIVQEGPHPHNLLLDAYVPDVTPQRAQPRPAGTEHPHQKQGLVYLGCHDRAQHRAVLFRHPNRPRIELLVFPSDRTLRKRQHLALPHLPADHLSYLILVAYQVRHSLNLAEHLLPPAHAPRSHLLELPLAVLLPPDGGRDRARSSLGVAFPLLDRFRERFRSSPAACTHTLSHFVNPFLLASC
jgi:hypothetical protein